MVLLVKDLNAPVTALIVEAKRPPPPHLPADGRLCTWVEDESEDEAKEGAGVLPLLALRFLLALRARVRRVVVVVVDRFNAMMFITT